MCDLITCWILKSCRLKLVHNKKVQSLQSNTSLCPWFPYIVFDWLLRVWRCFRGGSACVFNIMNSRHRGSDACQSCWTVRLQQQTRRRWGSLTFRELIKMSVHVSTGIIIHLDLFNHDTNSANKSDVSHSSAVLFILKNLVKTLKASQLPKSCSTTVWHMEISVCFLLWAHQNS